MSARAGSIVASSFVPGAVDRLDDGRRDRGGRTVEGDAPLTKADDAGRVGQRRLELVLAHDEREPMLAIDRLENVHDAAGERGIEAGGGFVGQNDRGPLGEGARDGHSLLLAARERVGAAAGEVYQPHLCEARARELAVGVREAPEHARYGWNVAESSGQNVLQHRGAAHQVELLKHHADLPANRAELGGAGAGDGAAGHVDRAGGGLDEPVERAEKRGLAGAAPAEHHDELTLTDDEVDPVKRDRRRRQDDAQPRDLDHRRRSGRTQRGRTPSSSIAARTGSYSRSSAGANPSIS